jgi:hypothetical protein
MLRGMMFCAAPVACAAPEVDYGPVETESVDSCLMEPPAEAAPPGGGPPQERYFADNRKSSGDHESKMRRSTSAGKARPAKKQAKPTKKPGLLGKVANLFREHKKGVRGLSDEVDVSVDQSAYRRRATELVDAMNRGSDHLHALGVLSVQLAALVEDLESVGAGAAVLEPLRQLHAELTQLVRQKQPAAADVDRLWKRAQEVLRAFAAEPATTAK